MNSTDLRTLSNEIVACEVCPRLSEFRALAKSKHADYFCKGVPPFGDENAELLIVGLAPGLHGANRTGRPFTGDAAGIYLYEKLCKFGFGSKSVSVSADDGLILTNAAITNAVKCVPPENKPTPEEIKTCRPFLVRELEMRKNVKVVLALGTIAHNQTLVTFRELTWSKVRLADYKFAHGAEHLFPDLGLTLIDTYHFSRYNINTGKLTDAMLDRVFEQVRNALAASG
ncbi:MAG: uracil-DNA glycosylase [Planctomycetes bacterium]|nr:uracil-DNA glycosylase [Planctomycetota bacterium]